MKKSTYKIAQEHRDSNRKWARHKQIWHRREILGGHLIFETTFTKSHGIKSLGFFTIKMTVKCSNSLSNSEKPFELIKT